MPSLYSISAITDVANGFTKEQASDAPPIGPPTGGSPGSVPVVGTTVLLGVVAPEPSD